MRQAETGRTDLYAASFIAFAPADDPQSGRAGGFDEPMVQQKTGGITAAPWWCGASCEDILPYIGVEPAYSADELALQDIAVPNVTGKTESGSGQRFGKSGPDYRVVGDGDTVTDQVPSYGAKIPWHSPGGAVYGRHKTGRAGPGARCNRPFRGRGPVSAGAGRPLYMKGTGAADSTGNVVASKQNVTGQAPVGDGGHSGIRRPGPACPMTGNNRGRWTG